MLRLGLAFLMVVFVSGCGAMKPQDFENKEPVFDVFSYFQGHSRAWGIFEDRFGTLRRQFTVDINGTVNDGVLTLTEDFLYDDGEKDQFAKPPIMNMKVRLTKLSARPGVFNMAMP